MPMLLFSNALTANGTNLPLDGWQYEYLPWNARCKLIQRATTTGVRCTITSGSETIAEEGQVQGAGTAGTTPSELNTAPQEWIAAAGDRLKVKLREVAGGTPTVDGIIVVEPV